tara:strand:- start:139 stop:807 length:669 start_codon:yes stop_codon:yes gene_type:complete
MEDASAVDLDWFWRGWFYTTDHVDISIDNMKYYKINTQNPSINKKNQEEKFIEIKQKDISNQRNSDNETYMDRDEKLKDFYTEYNPFEVTERDEKKYKKFKEGLSQNEKNILKEDLNFYEIKFSNIGGLVMPIILDFEFSDGSHEIQRIPAEIWQVNNDKITKVFAFKKEIKQVELDPFLETADTDRNNNYWPIKIEPSKFELYKFKDRHIKPSSNPMQKKK